MSAARHFRRKAWIRAALIGALSFCGSALAGPTGEPEPELRARLSAAIRAADSFEDRYDAEVWLKDMSGRMHRYIPKVMADEVQRIEFLRNVHAEARRANLSPELVLAVINIESRFDRYALSKAGAQGYMQIMPFWLKEIGQPGDNLMSQTTNLRMGCTILKFYLDKERGSYIRALARYNGSYGKPDYPYLVLDALNKRWSPI